MADTDTDAPALDAHGVVVIDDAQRSALERLRLVATEPPGSVRPCGSAAHEPQWHRRPWPQGDMTCDVCHPSIEQLRAEGFPRGTHNLAPAPYVGRHIAPPGPKWTRPSSDTARPDGPAAPAGLLDD